MSEAYGFAARSSSSVEVRRDGSSLRFVWVTSGSKGAPDALELARYDAGSDLLRIFPRVHLADVDLFDPQFDQVHELQIVAAALGWDPEDAVSERSDGRLELVEGDGPLQELHGLPKGFGRYFQYGLGFPRAYRGLVRAIESLTDCTVVCFGGAEDEGVRDNICHVALERFDRYKLAVDLNRARGDVVVGRVNRIAAQNSIAELAGLPAEKLTLGRHPVVQAITRAITDETPLDVDERSALVARMSLESRRVASDSPQQFGQLRSGIELVALEVLIEQFESAMQSAGKGRESKWQAFFELNVFALQQLFAAPVALYGSQLHLRMPNMHGAGARIADFVLVNTLTRNAVVVEIKTPATRLVGRPYRGAGVATIFPPHAELAGAVVQVQAQMESAATDFRDLVRRTADAEEVDTLVIRGAVIAGSVESLSSEERRSFVRYRSGLHGVEVLAFDEVLGRLQGLRQFLSGSPSTVDNE